MVTSANKIMGLKLALQLFIFIYFSAIPAPAAYKSYLHYSLVTLKQPIPFPNGTHNHPAN
jgi:hypothetical protein